VASLDDLVAQLAPAAGALPSATLAPQPGATSAALPLIPSGSAPNLGSGGGSPSSVGPVLASQPDNFTKLTNKWAELAALNDLISPEIVGALIDYDAERVARGSQPLTREQTIKAAVAARDNRQVTQEPDRSAGITALPGNAVRDLGTIVSGIPRLPLALVKEAQAVGEIPQHIAQAQADGRNMIEAVASAPGIRMLPGAFIAENLTNPAEFLRHPLFTALDVLPGAKAAGVGPKLAATAPGRAIASAADTFKTATAPGRLLSAAFGGDARDVARTAEELGGRLQNIRDGVTQPANPFEQFLRDAATIAERHTLSPEDVTSATRAAQLGDYTGLSGQQLAFLDEARGLAHEQGRRLVDLDELGQVEIDGRIEFYPRDQAQKLNRARGLATTADRFAALRTEMMNPTGRLTIDDFERGLESAVDTFAFDRSLGMAEARAIAQTMSGYGYDTTALRKALRTGKEPAAALEQFRASRDALIPDEMMPLMEIVGELKRHRKDIMADRLTTAIADGNTTRITSSLNSILNRQKFTLPVTDDARFVRSVRAVRDRLRFDETTFGKYTDQHAENLARRAERLMSRKAPARFEPAIGETARQQFTEQVMPAHATPDQAAAITQAVLESRWGAVSELTGGALGADELASLRDTIVKDVTATWRQMQQQGLDPIFVHKTTRGRASQLATPRIGPVPQTLSQARERFMHWGDLESDLTVSLGHQAMEMLNRQATEQFVEHVVQSYGVKSADLRETFADQARDAAARSGTTFEQALRDLIDRRFEVFNPDKAGYSWGGGRLDQFRQDEWMIPKPLADNLHRMASPRGPIQTVFDPVSKTFRMSVIGLSPRTHLYNILGGAVMLFGETGPRGFAYLSDAWKMARDPASITDEALKATMGSGKRAWTNEDFARAQASTLTGRTMARVLGEHHQSVSKAGKAVSGVVDKSLTFNSLIDDMYRSAAYLYGRDKALTKGLTREAAESAGRELMRKTMMDWVSLTPIERGVFKSIFPFYSFIRHSMQYVARYPVDHPLRASVVSAFGRAEQEDLGALPGSFLQALFVGAPDADRNALQLGGVNPFGDVANMFTVAGFLSSTNPMLTTVLEQAGLIRGAAELYPTLRYDPGTGRLTAQQSNPLVNFAENVIPQTQVLTGLLGMNADLNSQMRSNPDAFRRSLASSVGLPIVWRNYNVPAEIAKAEVARQRSEDLAKDTALESGNWDEALRYPGLRPFFDQLSTLPPEVLAAYQPKSREAISEQLRILVSTTSSGTGAGQSRGGGM